MSNRPVALAGEEARRAQAALRVGGAAGRPVRDLDALAGAGEQHRVVADDVAAAHAGEADASTGRARRSRLRGRRPRSACRSRPERRGDHLAHLQRGAAGRIDLVAVVRLDDLDVVALGQRRARPCRAACSMTLTPTLMLGAITIAMCSRDARRSRPSARRSKPVVPITASTPSSRHSARCASVPSGRVKSISTSASARPARRSAVTGTPLVLAEERGGVLADAPGCRAGRARRRARSRRLRATASISMRPMRPEAPATAIAAQRPARPRRHESRLERRVAARRRRRRRGSGVGAAASAAPAAPCSCSSVSAERRRLAARLEGVDRGDELALARQLGRLSTRSSASPSKQHDDAAQLRLGALAPDREDVVPAVGVEQVGEQRRAEHVAHLRAASCRA